MGKQIDHWAKSGTSVLNRRHVLVQVWHIYKLSFFTEPILDIESISKTAFRRI